MDALATYRLSDFILFSATAYYRQFQLYNEAIWPLHVVAAVFALLIVFAVWKSPAWSAWVVAAILIVSWLWVGWAFLYQRFYQIHVIADWYAIAFALQAILVTGCAVIKKCFVNRGTNRLRLTIASLLLLLAIIVYPCIAILSGRPWQQAEVFALAPDPTAIATVAILVFYKSPTILFVIPVTWLLVSAITLSVM